ncbi:MAG: hydroxyethylthiazole kinase [Methanobacteriaceae archaeon]|jgi:hydroxyethylthiazole kinase|nr:hydroxyethylthiazole kinase [Methanobacteriaceae archaeon]
MEQIADEIKNALENIKEKKPLTQCITNVVTVNDCANAVLAVGASPIMADDAEEVEEIVEIADTLVVNIGKLSETQIEAMNVACKYASKTKTPITIDPVGCGISNLRNKTTMDIINNYYVSVIRGNMSEIKAIGNLLEIKSDNSEKAKGVDANESDIITKENLKTNSLIVEKVSKKTNAVVIASGPIDIISDGEKTIAIENGDSMMERITGSGCMLSSIVGSFIGSSDTFNGSIAATLIMSIAGENAKKYVDEHNLGTGTFRSKLIDNLYKLDSEEIIEKGNIYTIE